MHSKVAFILSMLVIIAIECIHPLSANSDTLNREKTSAGLRFNGVYKINKKKSSGTRYWQYLRFYPNGDVIKVSSTGSPEKIQKWFTRLHRDVSRGKVKSQDNRISFTLVSPQGAVDYAGEVYGNQLRLDSYSHINQHLSSAIYSFVELHSEVEISAQTYRRKLQGKENILSAQRKLKLLRYFAGEPDGFLGSQTSKAIEAFVQKHYSGDKAYNDLSNHLEFASQPFLMKRTTESKLIAIETLARYKIGKPERAPTFVLGGCRADLSEAESININNTITTILKKIPAGKFMVLNYTADHKVIVSGFQQIN